MFLIHVVSFRPAAPMTNAPIQTLPSPVILSPAAFPKAVLLAPVVFILSAPTPIAVLKLPSVLALKADAPLAVFPSAVVLLKQRVVTDRRVEATRGVGEGECSIARVVAAGTVIDKRAHSSGRVVCAGGVKQKRCSTGGRIVVSGVEVKRSSANSSIETAGGVGKEREVTNRGIIAASGGASKCVLPFCRIASGIASVRWWADGLRVLDQRKTQECKCD